MCFIVWLIIKRPLLVCFQILYSTALTPSQNPLRWSTWGRCCLNTWWDGKQKYAFLFLHCYAKNWFFTFHYLFFSCYFLIHLNVQQWILVKANNSMSIMTSFYSWQSLIVFWEYIMSVNETHIEMITDVIRASAQVMVSSEDHGTISESLVVSGLLGWN